MHAYLSNSNMNFLPVPLPNFGAAIKRRRIELGLSRGRAAASLGINKDLLELIEEQGWIPTKNENFLRCLAAALEIRYDDLARAIEPLEAHFENAQDLPMDEHHHADRPAA